VISEDILGKGNKLILLTVSKGRTSIAANSMIIGLVRTPALGDWIQHDISYK